MSNKIQGKIMWIMICLTSGISDKKIQPIFIINSQLRLKFRLGLEPINNAPTIDLGL